MTQVFTATQSKVIGNLMRGLQREIRSTIRRQASEIKRAERARNVAVAKAEREGADRKVLEVKRLDLAMKGCANLIALGLSHQLQEFFALWRKREEVERIPSNIWTGQFPVYGASRPSGDAWDTDGTRGGGSRDVEICLMVDRIYIAYGSKAAASMEEFSVPYASTEVERRKLLKEVSTSASSDCLLALDENQRDYEWHPPAVTFQLFVDCAKAATLRKYLKLIMASSMFSTK